jgi:hypothetical protein
LAGCSRLIPVINIIYYDHQYFVLHLFSSYTVYREWQI